MTYWTGIVALGLTLIVFILDIAYFYFYRVKLARNIVGFTALAAWLLYGYQLFLFYIHFT